MFAEVIIKMLLKFEYHVERDRLRLQVSDSVETAKCRTIVTNDPSRSWLFLLNIVSRSLWSHCNWLPSLGVIVEGSFELALGRKSAYFILIGAAMEFLLCVRRDFLMIGDRIIKVIKRPLAVVAVQIDVVVAASSAVAAAAVSCCRCYYS